VKLSQTQRSAGACHIGIGQLTHLSPTKSLAPLYKYFLQRAKWSKLTITPSTNIHFRATLNRLFSHTEVSASGLRLYANPQADAVSQPDVVDEQIQSDDELKTKVLDLFPTTLPQPDPWGQFSNHSWDSIPGHQGHLTSIEEIHDRIHGYVGGPGHMGVVPFSAFDPVFWLHHCMIDRIFALWEAVYPGVYVSPGPGACISGFLD